MYNITSIRYSDGRSAPVETLMDQDFTSKTKAITAFHTLAKKHIRDSEVFISLGIINSQSRSFTMLMSKYRGDRFVEIHPTYYEGIK
jgi:hypothetical protein